MCGKSGHHHGGGCHCGCKNHHQNDSCNCGESTRFGRRFLTKAEKVARLEAYLADLQAETKAVEERIAMFKEDE